jgi:hypothetical protein
MWLGHEGDHFHLLLRFKNEWNFTSTPHMFHCLVEEGFEIRGFHSNEDEDDVLGCDTMSPSSAMK